MVDAAQMLSGINSHIYVILFGIAIAVAMVKLEYHQIASVLKWLALVLFAYVITAIHIGPNWGRCSGLPSSQPCRKGRRVGEWGMSRSVLKVG